jgi:hypothetical protein
MFVIILNAHLPTSFNDWPISGRGETLEEARAIQDYDGSPDYVPKGNIRMDWQEAKRLRNRRTGQFEDGGIYQAVREIEK